MKEKLIAVLMILSFVFVFSLAANYALSRHDPLTNVKWVEYTTPKNTYLSNLAGTLSNKLRRDPGALVQDMRKVNQLSDYFIAKGTKILVPNPI